MKMLIKISWRNVWRNHQRSLTMVFAITAGLWAGISTAALMMGLMQQRFKTGIEQEISHAQIHHPDFLRDNNPAASIAQWETINGELSAHADVKSFSGRTIAMGMIATANQTNGIQILGIDPEREARTTGLKDNIVEGEYFGEDIRVPLLMGKSLAEKMKANPGTRVVLTFQDLSNELVSISCRVAGIYQTANPMYDEFNIYMLQSELSEYLGSDNIVNQVAILFHDLEVTSDFASDYQQKYPDLLVRTWAEISPQLGFYTEMGMAMFMIILIIILLALAFGLLNTMLMSVFERTRELGMLMSIGMNKKRIFTMILLETVFLTLTGAAGGILTGYATVWLTQKNGINLGTIGGEALNDFGFNPVVYPFIDGSLMVSLTFLVILTAILTSIYPAMKALRLQPAEAVRAE